MPRFYFDVQQNSQMERDFIGAVIPSGQDVRHYALRVITELLLDATPARQHNIRIGVRDETGKQVYVGDLVYQDGSSGINLPVVG